MARSTNARAALPSLCFVLAVFATTASFAGDPDTSATDAADSSTRQTLSQSRALLRNLRSGKPIALPIPADKPAAAKQTTAKQPIQPETTAPRPAKKSGAKSSTNTQFMQLNGVLPTAGEEISDTTGIVRLPNSGALAGRSAVVAAPESGRQLAKIPAQKTVSHTVVHPGPHGQTYHGSCHPHGACDHCTVSASPWVYEPIPVTEDALAVHDDLSIDAWTVPRSMGKGAILLSRTAAKISEPAVDFFDPTSRRYVNDLSIDAWTVPRSMGKGAILAGSAVVQVGKDCIHYEDPACNYHVDEHRTAILLVAAQEETPTDPIASGSGLLSRKLTDIKPTLDYAWGDLRDEQLPPDFHERMDNGPYVERTAPRTVVQWEPTNLWYYPLYFEDVGLERYGHTRKPWLQPFVSSGKFMTQVVGLPYQMTLHPRHSREYALGYYQPGEWAPKKAYQIPWNEEAAATEFLWITGLVLLIP